MSNNNFLKYVVSLNGIINNADEDKEREINCFMSELFYATSIVFNQTCKCLVISHNRKGDKDSLEIRGGEMNDGEWILTKIFQRHLKNFPNLVSIGYKGVFDYSADFSWLGDTPPPKLTTIHLPHLSGVSPEFTRGLTYVFTRGLYNSIDYYDEVGEESLIGEEPGIRYNFKEISLPLIEPITDKEFFDKLLISRFQHTPVVY